MSSSPWSDEKTIQLILTTLVGEEPNSLSSSRNLTASRSLSAVLEQLPDIGESSTFGCELDFVCRNSQQKLWTRFGTPCETAIALQSFRACVLRLPNIRSNCKKKPKLRKSLSMLSTESSHKPFSHVARVRHAQVDAGHRIIEERAHGAIANTSKLCNWPALSACCARCSPQVSAAPQMQIGIHMILSPTRCCLPESNVAAIGGSHVQGLRKSWAVPLHPVNTCDP